MRRKLFALVLLMLPIMASAQNKVAITDKFSVEGKIKQPFEFSLNDAVNFKTQSIDSVVITNHLMERRSTIKSIKGILLKDVLSKMEIDAESPKVKSEFYLTCVATDNYKVVFSWNELFKICKGTSENNRIEDKLIVNL